MRRYFNTEGQCDSDMHYMVRLDERLRRIKERYVDRGKYFVINRGRQYGKTTTLIALSEYLKEDYVVLFMDFQKMSSAAFENENKFAVSFARRIVGIIENEWREMDGLALQELNELLYLKPIINGVGNYYLEAQTRDARRTDVIVDYMGEQFIVELKIWHDNEYKERGEEQLLGYLDYYHQDKGYLLSFNFNKKKQIGMKKITKGDKTIVEAVV